MYVQRVLNYLQQDIKRKKSIEQVNDKFSDFFFYSSLSTFQNFLNNTIQTNRQLCHVAYNYTNELNINSHFKSTFFLRVRPQIL